MARTKRIDFNVTIGGDVEAEIVANYTPGYAGSWYRSNGDPGDPPESPEVEIVSISDGDREIDPGSLSAAERDRIEERAMIVGENRGD